MLIDVRDVIALSAFHFIADFVLQSERMAVNKSKQWRALTEHVLTYSAVFWILCGWKFALITFGCHFLTDAATSRVNAKTWANKNTHWFFVGVGFDQWTHLVQLTLTYAYLNK